MDAKGINKESAFNTLMRPKSPWNKTPAERAQMTIACHDADELPRVKNAGSTTTIKGVKVQIMHNGLVVKKNGYQGEWQAETIKTLKGVHEPQEEKVFSEVIKRLKGPATMMELGSWWSYYSMWFVKEVPNAKAICCEPDPTNLELGRANIALNGFKESKEFTFYAAAAGSRDGKVINFTNEDGSQIKIPIRTVDSIIDEQKLARVDLLHLDIQGVELDALKGAQQSIKAGKIRFVFISTHHYSISGDPLMHQKVLDLLRKHGGHIIASHTILESCSGDGLIVASFDDADKDFKVEVSLQHSDDSLFRGYEYDVDILWENHEQLVRYVSKLEQDASNKQADITRLNAEISELRALIDEVIPLRKHAKRQVKIRLNRLLNKQ